MSRDVERGRLGEVGVGGWGEGVNREGGERKRRRRGGRGWGWGEASGEIGKGLERW